jgi:hypothetical protein
MSTTDRDHDLHVEAGDGLSGNPPDLLHDFVYGTDERDVPSLDSDSGEAQTTFTSSPDESLHKALADLARLDIEQTPTD